MISITSQKIASLYQNVAKQHSLKMTVFEIEPVD
jgi:hypothetical protein